MYKGIFYVGEILSDKTMQLCFILTEGEY